MTTPHIHDPTGAVAHIRGALGEKVLSKSPELFNQGLPTVLAEALQNARRAGATRVDIELYGKDGDATLSLRDDGCGIEDLAKLVTFGASGWDEHTDIVENAAGMGVFSLASRGVVVRSRGKRVNITRTVFCGEASAPVLLDMDIGQGTELLFQVPEHGVDKAIEHAARFYPLPVTINGKPVQQREFLAGADHIVEWRGLRLGVFRGHGPLVSTLFDRFSTNNRLYLNFHGHVVECRDSVKLSEIDGPTWKVFVDVLSAPDLRLVLPARQGPVENDFLRALRARGERAIFECIGRQPKHSLTHTDFRRAEALGVALPPVVITLEAWRTDSDECKRRYDILPAVRIEAGSTALVVDHRSCAEAGQSANLLQVAKHWKDGPQLVRAREGFAGYPDYDALGVIAGVAATITKLDGVEAELLGSGLGTGDDPGSDDRQVVRSIRARLPVRESAESSIKPTIRHAVEVPFLFTSDADWDGELPGLAVAEGTDPGVLTDALVECFFSESDDADADSYDRQLDRFETEARDLARTLLLPGAEAAMARIVDDLQRIRWSLLNLVGGTIELRIEKGDASSIRIVTAEGQTMSATL